ncbi:MAG: hypothetical protein HY719_07095 [Planctomycetes bacterium]|nr:hypothetical protein [Planctomycetota bacterium]
MAVVRDQLEALWRLQQLDVEIDAVAARAARIEGERRARAAAVESRAAILAEAQQRLKTVEFDRRSAEKDLAAQEAAVRKIKSREALSAGAAVYAAREKDLAKERQRLSVAETRVLSLMEEADKLRESTVTLTRERDQAAEALAAFSRESAAAAEAATAEIAKLGERRAPIAAAVSADWLARYDRFREKGKRAVAEVRAHHCAACDAGLTLRDLGALLDAKTVQTCRACGCVLYLDPARAAEELRLSGAGAEKPAPGKPG